MSQRCPRLLQRSQLLPCAPGLPSRAYRAEPDALRTPQFQPSQRNGVPVRQLVSIARQAKASGLSDHTEVDNPSTVSDSCLAKMDQYLHLVLEQNKVMNLTAVRDLSEARVRHTQDSLTILPMLHQQLAKAKAPRLLDVGSGAGFPGVVLAIARPDWEVVLLDSVRKRCDFLTRACTTMDIPNVRVVWARAEAAGQSRTHREVYDVVVARAVAEMRVLAELCLPFVRPGGAWVALKGPDPEAEITSAASAIKELGGASARIEPMQSFAQHGQRNAVIVAKTGITPMQYPRKEGIPKKQPL